MSDSVQSTSSAESRSFPFKAETRQLLDILIHSLYTEREIFLRELISNASDALTRIDFEILTNRDVLDPEAELAIHIIPNEKENTLIISDSGIGMTAEELVEDLGTIAHSGARAFIDAAKQSDSENLLDVIGQFGVGFYSAFMVAEWIKVVSRSFQPDAQAASWFSSGADTFKIEPAEKSERGTTVILKLKEDATEFTQESRLKEIIRKHSDFIPFPIYLENQEQQVNRQTALWRQQPSQVEQQEYHEFYKQLTLDFEPPLAYAHMLVDAPAQLYALLYVPANPERGPFSSRKDDGLKLYARKVLIQEYCKDLTPEYLRFVQGVVDSEDLPLNISRESVQSTRMMMQLKKLVTSKVLDTLVDLAKKDQKSYNKFWESYDRYLKQGVAIEQTNPEDLYPLLRFHTTAQPAEWSSLDDYLARMQPDQKHIYYILGDDEASIQYSPHLDIVHRYNYEVLLLTDPFDPLLLVKLDKYKGIPLGNVASADLELPPAEKDESQSETEGVPEPDFAPLIERFKSHLGDRVVGVQITNRLADSPARLVDPEGAPNQEMQRLYHLLNKEFEVPKKILELNPQHPILKHLIKLPEEDPVSHLVIDQIYEDALLIEGMHPNPASMIPRIQKIIESALT